MDSLIISKVKGGKKEVHLIKKQMETAEVEKEVKKITKRKRTIKNLAPRIIRVNITIQIIRQQTFISQKSLNINNNSKEEKIQTKERILIE